MSFTENYLKLKRHKGLVEYLPPEKTGTEELTLCHTMEDFRDKSLVFDTKLLRFLLKTLQILAIYPQIQNSVFPSGRNSLSNIMKSRTVNVQIFSLKQSTLNLLLLSIKLDTSLHISPLL